MSLVPLKRSGTQCPRSLGAEITRWIEFVPSFPEAIGATRAGQSRHRDAGHNAPPFSAGGAEARQPPPDTASRRARRACRSAQLRQSDPP